MVDFFEAKLGLASFEVISDVEVMVGTTLIAGVLPRTGLVSLIYDEVVI